MICRILLRIDFVNRTSWYFVMSRRLVTFVLHSLLWHADDICLLLKMSWTISTLQALSEIVGKCQESPCLLDSGISQDSLLLFLAFGCRYVYRNHLFSIQDFFMILDDDGTVSKLLYSFYNLKAFSFYSVIHNVCSILVAWSAVVIGTFPWCGPIIMTARAGCFLADHDLDIYLTYVSAWTRWIHSSFFRLWTPVFHYLLIEKGRYSLVASIRELRGLHLKGVSSIRDILDQKQW